MENAARARLDGWKQSLLAAADRLLDAADHGIPIAGDPVRLVFSLVGGTRYLIEPAEAASLEAGRIRVASGASELVAKVAGLRRAARDALADGEHVLWLAIGELEWLDADGGAHAAPLVLWPVTLDRDAAGVTRLIAATDRAPRHNDVLAARLRADHGVELDVQAELDLVRVLDAVAAIAADRDGWRVHRTARLGMFAFAPYDLARDLARLDDSAAPLAWIACDQAPPALPPGETIDDLVMPLDADATQVAALAAAAAGGSFVLHAAPGTGKTQTIANLIAQCASQGRSVLVVSDRRAALDAIRRRLDGVGLAELCSTSGDIARPSRPHVQAPSGPTIGRTRLAEVTDRLDRHVAAMHGRSSDISIHDALARLVELRTTPNAALEEPDADSLDRATFERRRIAATELAAAAVRVEPVAEHPWRASVLDAWHDGLTARAANALELAGDAATELACAIALLATLVPGITTRTAAQLAAVGRLAEVAASSPRPGAELLAGSRGRPDDIGERVALVRARGGGAIDPPRDPATYVAIALRQRSLAAEVAEVFTDAVEQLDAGELWTQLKRWNASMAPLRYVALRTARATVQAAAIPLELSCDEAMITALEAAIAERACRAALAAAAEPARRWFGALGTTGAVERLEAALAWATELRRAFDQLTVAGGESRRQDAWRALVAQVTDAGDGDRADLVAFARLGDAVARYQPAIAALADATGIPTTQLGAGHDHLAALRLQIDALARSVDAFADWTRYHLAKRTAIDAGLRSIVVASERGDLAAADLALAWERATLLEWVAAAIGRAPELVRFDGAALHVAVTSFADLDRGAMAVARGRIPRHATCVLATPAQVARTCNMEIDVVVFDEASRLPVAHALGALSRARAAIVIGDVRQPGPADGAEGLLAAALAAGFPELELGAHYRSRHHDLFAFANHRYYGNRIAQLPAAQPSGLAWRRVDGAPDIAGANRVEAEAVVADVVARFREGTPSVAVIALSRAQQQLIEDLLDDERVKDRALAQAFAAGPEPLLVGTPDRLAGEARDIVLLSITGSPPLRGNSTIGDSADSLGALAHAGAERWLAVATTRARDQLVLISSFAPEDVTADAPSAWRGLAELLAFARDGGSPIIADAAPSSPITAAIARALAERGWTVRHQVGAVELAVVDPDDPSRCVLAIEHDGTAYARTTPARDRDRLRTQELARLGWRVHRVWALDWWLDPERETQRAHGAIVAAVAAGRRRAHTPPPITAKPRRPIATPVATPRAETPAPLADGSGPTPAAPLRVARGTIPIGPYVAAAIPPGRRVQNDMFGGRHQAELGKVVEQVLAAEAPIHLELLARRVGAYFGVGRVTPEIVAQVRGELDGRGRFCDEPDVVWRLDQDPTGVPAVRVAGASAVACRDIVQIPLFEIAAAARIVVERAGALSSTDLARDTSRLLGFARITDRITDRVAQGIRLAAERELIALDQGRALLVVAG